MKAPSPRRGRILVVDDEEGIRTFLAESLERDRHEVVQAANGSEALLAARREPFDVILTDLKMPVLDGMALVRAVRTEQPNVEVVVLTAFGDVSTAVEAMKLGAFDYLQKPVSGPQAVRQLVQAALERRAALRQEKGEAAAGVGALSFGAPSMVPVIDAIGKVARTQATVLLLGESGSGKEVAARAIHQASPRAEKPFMAINCAVLTESLLESELFGHEKGAFTGAHTQRKGRIELADGGTFFLDEVGELKSSLQAKLLRVLEEKTFERLGGSQSFTADVRWVAATHQDLRKMVKAGSFREDLYHRLAVFPIRLPPLRERREDIAPLAESLVRMLASESQRSGVRLSPQAIEKLVQGRWPGNIRQLRNVLERAMILSEGAELGPEHMDVEPGEEDSEAEATSEALDGSLTEMEKVAIERALATVHGNRKAAAEKLGIGLRTLYDKLRRYGIK